jgi:dTDP-4-amino-4,6-dideoxygalactose transaminase
LPNRLTSQRFADQLASLEADRQRREAVFHHLAAEMKIYPDIEPIKPASHCRPAAYYLSFVFKAKGARDVFANAMLRHGLPVVWAWNSVPAHYRCFSENAIGGSGGSEYLAAHVCHIPLTEYVSHRRQQRLIALLTSSEWHARR